MDSFRPGKPYAAPPYTDKRLRKDFSDSILRNAEANLSAGMGSRLPFLKKVLCEGRAPDAESARDSPVSGLLQPGQAFSLSWAKSSIEDSDAFHKTIGRLNSSAAYSGYQAFPTSLDPTSDADCYVVRRCFTGFIGDLKVTWPASGSAGAGIFSGLFVNPLFQVFLNFSPSGDFAGTACMMHETEHALHDSLPSPNRGVWGIPPEDSERLALLRTISMLGDMNSFLVDRKYPRLATPFLAAVRGLRSDFEVHGIGRADLAFACSYWSSRNDIHTSLIPSAISWEALSTRAKNYGSYGKEDTYRRVVGAASAEYERRFKESFLLSPAEAGDIVSGMSL